MLSQKKLNCNIAQHTSVEKKNKHLNFKNRFIIRVDFTGVSSVTD